MEGLSVNISGALRVDSRVFVLRDHFLTKKLVQHLIAFLFRGYIFFELADFPNFLPDVHLNLGFIFVQVLYLCFSLFLLLP